VTELLYHRDPLLLEFDATVVAHGAIGGRPSVVLDRTAFYPEAGGQMADRGRLAGAAIADVQVADGAVHHVLDGELPAVGASVHGTIDKPRRRAFMALHTAQHILSRALIEAARAETVSARLGETSCTVDLAVATLDDAALARAVDLTNAVIDDDVPIRAWFPDDAELATLPLRRESKVDANVRIVAVGDFDLSPCGGTHCTRSAQVALVEVLGVERYKGMMRVTFDAGPRARRLVSAQSSSLRAMAGAMSCGPSDVPGAVERLRGDLKDARVARRLLGERAAGAIAAELAADATGRIVAVLDAGDRELLRAVAARLTERPEAVALLAVREGDGLAVLAARGSASSFDCGALVKRVAAAAGGKGGGRPERAEGKLPLGADWPALVG
jgi:alanyl-tRNA synthetase